MREQLKKVNNEAEYFERQALASKRFTSPEGDVEDDPSLDDPSIAAPSPADSLNVALAASSTGESLPDAVAASMPKAAAPSVSSMSLAASMPEAAA